MHNNENNSKLSLNKSSVSSSNIKPLSRFQKRAQEQAQAQQQRELSASKERKVEATPWTKGSLMSSSSNIKPLSRFQKRAQEQAQAQQQRELSASKERKVEATPWTKGSLMSQNKDQDRFGERKERSFGERRERGPRRDGERSFGERFERGPRRDGERSFGERRERGPRREGERSFGERRERGPRREDRGGARRERAPRMDAQNLYDVAGDFDSSNSRPERVVTDARTIYECEVPIGRMTELAICEITEKGAFVDAKDFDSSNSRPERVVTDARTIYECEVPIGRMTELAICEITEKGAFVDAKDHGPLFIPRSQLPDEAQEGDLIRVFLYKDGERTLATARRPYIELGMTGNLRINSVENGTAYLDLGIPKELVLPVSEQRFRMYEGDNALVLVCIDNLGRLFGTQCFNRYIRDKSFPHEFEDNQRVKIVAVAHTPLGFRVIVDDKVYGLIYQSEQKGELIIGKRYDGFVKTVRPDGRLDISLQEAGREGVEHASLDILQALYFSEGKFDFNDKSEPEKIEEYLKMSKGRFKKALGAVEHASLDILQALYFSEGKFDFNDKSEPEKIEEYLKMSKGRFKKALGALYKQRFVEITDDGVLLTPEGQNFANERFAHLANKGQSNIDSESDSNGLADSVESSYDDMDALANADVGADQDPMVDAVVSAVAQARKEGKLPTGYHNNEVKSYQRSDFNKAEPEQALETTSWGENLDELGDFAGRRSAVNEMSGFGNERSAHRHDRGPRRDGERRERSPRRERSFGERGPRREGERRERSFGERRERGPRRESHSFRGKR